MENRYHMLRMDSRRHYHPASEDMDTALAKILPEVLKNLGEFFHPSPDSWGDVNVFAREIMEQLGTVFQVQVVDTNTIAIAILGMMVYYNIETDILHLCNGARVLDLKSNKKE